MARMYLDSGGAATNSGTSDSNSPDLSGVANATVVANSTFTDANVTVASDQIAIAAHGYTSGTGVVLTTSGTLPTGLALNTLYFVFAVNANTITLHNTVADAEAGTNPVNITAAAGGGTHTVNNYTVNLGGAPDLSGLFADAFIITTTGTSHVATMQGGPHGLSTGASVFLMTGPNASPTLPGGLTNIRQNLFVNALSSTTLRFYSTQALAIAGGASDINVSSAGVGTFRIISTTTQNSAINLASASNSNRKIFWIRAYSNTNKLVIVDLVVTGLGGGSNWAIGGRVEANGAIEAA